jgi:hypothetical protein
MTRKQRILRAVILFAIGPIVFGVAVILAIAGADTETVSLVGTLGFLVWFVFGIASFALLLRPLSRSYSLMVAAGAVGLFILSALLHNVVYGLFEVEEPVFFTLALVISPALFLGALLAAFSPRVTTDRAGVPDTETGLRLPVVWRPPSSRVGQFGLGLLVAAGLGFLLFFGGVAAGQRGGATFFSNPFLALTILFAGACVVLAGVAALYAVVREHERSFGAFATIVFGVFVAVFAAGEIGGHDDPGSSPSPTPTPVVVPNSHTNLSVSTVSETEVRVTFDYSYNHDPPEARITMITVTPLDESGGPLPDYPVTRLPEGGVLQRGDGHVDLTLAINEDMLARVAAFRVCFAAPGHADLGCASAHTRR